MKRFILAALVAVNLPLSLPIAQAQDERFLRELLSERYFDPSLKPSVTNQYFRTVSPFYEIDLDGNGRHETLVLEKAGGRDFIHIHDYEGKRLFSGEFTPLGERSHVFKVNFKSIGGGYKVLLLQYYEGF